MIAERETHGSEQALTVVVFGLLLVVVSFDLGPIRFVTHHSLLLLVHGAMGVLGIWLWSGHRQREMTLPAFALVGCFSWMTLVAPVNDGPIQSLVVALGLLGTVLAGLSFGQTLTPALRRDTALVAISIPLAAAAVLQTEGATDARWIGWSEEPNQLASVAALALVLSVAAMLDGRRIAVITVALSTIVLAATEARLPTMAAFVSCISLFVRTQPLWRKAARVVTPVAIVGAIAAAVAFILVAPSSKPEVVNDLATVNDRTGVWGIATEWIARSPFTGVGQWQTHRLLEFSLFDDRADWGPTHMHNAILEATVSSGVPAGFLLAMSGVLFFAIRRPRLPLDAAIAVCVIFISLTEHVVRSPSVPLLLFAVALGSRGGEATVHGSRRGRGLTERLLQLPSADRNPVVVQTNRNREQR